MRDVLASLFTSKKFLAMVAGIALTVILRVAGKFGIALDPATAKEAADAIALLVGSYCIGQGVADHGKEAAIINADVKASDPAAAVSAIINEAVKPPVKP